MKIYILTGNQGKILAAKSVFDKYKIDAEFIDKDYPEIQAPTSLEIAKYTAIQASKELNIPIIREDHSLFINSIGIPGPYISYIEKRLQVSRLLEILSNQNDRSGYFEIAAVYANPDGTVKKFVFQVPISISKEERGELQNGWNRIIQLEGENRTLAEYPESERINVWNKNYEEIAKWLLEK